MFSKEKNMRYILTLILGLLATGCASRGLDLMTRYHEDGRAKPVAAVASMIDTSSAEIPWSLSEEFTKQIVQKVGQTGQIFVSAKEDEVFAENPFGQDLSWVTREFPQQEFVVFMELVEHETAPASKVKKGSDVSLNLNMAVRLRVVDVRGNQPKIVLQEIVRDSYFIPKTLLPTDYNTAVWGTSEFEKSPMGIAHEQIVQEISTRVSDYILLAKSR